MVNKEKRTTSTENKYNANLTAVFEIKQVEQSILIFLEFEMQEVEETFYLLNRYLQEARAFCSDF